MNDDENFTRFSAELLILQKKYQKKRIIFEKSIYLFEVL